MAIRSISAGDKGAKGDNRLLLSCLFLGVGIVQKNGVLYRLPAAQDELDGCHTQPLAGAARVVCEPAPQMALVPSLTTVFHCRSEGHGGHHNGAPFSVHQGRIGRVLYLQGYHKDVRKCHIMVAIISRDHSGSHRATAAGNQDIIE